LEKDVETLLPTDRKILKVIADGKTHADDIIAGTGLPVADVLSALITLELKEMIAQHPGKFFSIKK